ncbi:MAG: VOC family protein [Eubacteriales bacterium]|nr:VOC family protein [Eubacteriales bacterium]
MLGSAELKAKLEAAGATINHYGIYVRDIDKALEYILQFPLMGDANSFEHSFGAENIIVGAPFTIKCCWIKVKNADYIIELIQPYPDKIEDGSYFKKAALEVEPGFHHIAYDIPDYKLYKELLANLKKEGAQFLEHEHGVVAVGTPDEHLMEMAYIAAPADNGSNYITEIMCNSIE